MSMPYGKLVESERWMSFLESTALGLQLNLSMVSSDGTRCVHRPADCPNCGQAFADPDRAWIAGGLPGETRGIDDGAGALGLTRLTDGISLVARQCSCQTESGGFSLSQRAGIARKLLASFAAALGEGLVGGRRSVELTTLRQLNHFILSLFAGGDQAAKHAFDLMLSALIILLDARGSWLEYRSDAGPVRLVKGDGAAVDAYLQSGSGQDVTEAVTGGTGARLGVLGPGDGEQARLFLPLMAQECSIVFEINRLFGLLRSQLTRVLETLGSAIILLDSSLTVTYANAEAYQVLGCSGLDLLGQSVQVIGGPWVPAAVQKATQRISQSMDLLEGKDGIRWVDWQVCPMPDGDTTVGWVVVIDDRTDLHNYQVINRQAERLAATATLVSALAHELRNPLGAARGLLQILTRKREPEKIISYSNLIMQEIDRVTRLLNDFLLLGQPAQNNELVDLRALLASLKPILDGETVGSRVVLDFELSDVRPVLADVGQITQVITRLVRNAVEAMGMEGQVLLRLTGSGDSVELTVLDDGPGLPPGEAERIFEPFYSTKPGGTGLGLSVAQSIVSNHGGCIRAGNRPGGGAAMKVTLPVRGTDGREQHAIDILLVVGDEKVRFPAEVTLRQAGFTVIAATDIPTALTLAGEYQPELLVVSNPEQYHQYQDLIYGIWPEVRPLLVGQVRALPGATDSAPMPSFIDCARLIQQIKQIKGEARKDPAGESPVA